MHQLFEILSELLSAWPFMSGKRKERKPVRDARKISGLTYKPLCKITSDQRKDTVPHRDEGT
ncbi:hypothetical protein CIL06_06405 [Pantoea vagans]|uniref:Uncharacterized protein n=1 Tax=Pantoea vagans TaxID=470934 RepID=A0ABY3LBX3_9GAMM|nr:hypothetical protein CIL06_06405 [Pantoea vagans]TXL76134.1 hypothetical protein D9O29_18650 [Pantoea vagans]